MKKVAEKDGLTDGMDEAKLFFKNCLIALSYGINSLRSHKITYLKQAAQKTLLLHYLDISAPNGVFSSK